MLWIITGIISSYLLGSIPTAYIFGRLLKGVDIRKVGSGNVGATNALRVLGRGAGAAVLILDILKGVLAISVLGSVISKPAALPEEGWLVILGLSCICGHNWTVFLRFKGGKGIATTLGVLIGLAFKITALKYVLLCVILAWLGVFLFTRIVSISSVIAGISLPLFMLLFKSSKLLLTAGVILCLFVILRHKANLRRLLRGEEPCLNFKKH